MVRKPARVEARQRALHEDLVQQAHSPRGNLSGGVESLLVEFVGREQAIDSKWSA
jgi:hypothetical protein